MVTLTVTAPTSRCHPRCFQVKFNVPKASITFSYFLRGVVSLPGNYHPEAPREICPKCLFLLFEKKIPREMKY